MFLDPTLTSVLTELEFLGYGVEMCLHCPRQLSSVGSSIYIIRFAQIIAKKTSTGSCRTGKEAWDHYMREKDEQRQNFEYRAREDLSFEVHKYMVI